MTTGGRAHRRGAGSPLAGLVVVAAASAWLAAGAGDARAHAFDLFGFGARASALGSAYVALAEGYESSYYNPAGVVYAPGTRIGVGYLQTFSDLELDGRALEARDTTLSGVVLGGSFAGELDERRLGLAIGFLMPDSGSIRASVTAPLAPRFVLLSNRTQRAEVLVTAGVELVDGLAFGAGVAIGAELGGVVDLEATLLPEGVDGTADVRIQTRAFPLMGLAWRPVERWRFGLAYRGETTLPISIPATAIIAIGDEGTLSADLLLEVAQTYFYSPQQVVGGVAYDPLPELTATVDVEWKDWSAARDPGLIGRLEIGGELGGLLDVPDFVAPEDPGFEDVVVPRAGIEWRPPSLPWLAALRVGYAFEASPVPAPVGTRNWLDNDKHVASLGIGLRGRDPWGILLADAELDLHAQWHRFATRTARKLDPADPIGDLRFGGDRWLAGAMLTLHF